MCGIIGIVGRIAAAPRLLEGLKRLKYRGYDSAGIATLSNGGIERRRAEGKPVNLEARLGNDPLAGVTGIGHTRWVTHGVPNEINAHPHANNRVALVHNGIIDNFLDLKAELEAAGRQLASDTDTEVIAHLITHLLEGGLSPAAAAEAALARLDGAFALGIIFAGFHDLMIAARRGSPLAIGYGKDETFIGSDAHALAPMIQRITYLEDGDLAMIEGAQVSIRDQGGEAVERPITETGLSGALTGKDGHAHYMLKEIFEQPR